MVSTALLDAAVEPIDQTPAHSFDEPWQADAFATAVYLSRNGAFSWAEWVDVFSSEIDAHPQRDGETVSDAYYRQWLRSLEIIVGRHFGIQAHSILARQSRWREAYLHTRHGSQVLLENAPFGEDADYASAESDSESDHHDHHHSSHHDDGMHHDRARVAPKPKPIAISPAMILRQ
jgi:nitrile hydratase accessory protein